MSVNKFNISFITIEIYFDDTARNLKIFKSTTLQHFSMSSS